MSMQTSNHKTECNRWLKPTSLHTWPDITHNLTQEKTRYNWQTELKTKRQRKPNILMLGQFRISRKPGASVAGQMAWPTIKLKSAIFCCRTISTSLLTFRSGQVSYPRRGRVFFPNETRQIRFQWWNRTPLYKYFDRDQHLDSWWFARRLAIDPEPWKHNFSWVISCVCLWTVLRTSLQCTVVIRHVARLRYPGHLSTLSRWSGAKNWEIICLLETSKLS